MQMFAQGTVPPEGAAQESTSSRICFPFLNHGRCNHENCRFRHLAQDHPDAIADRMRTGAYDKIPQHANPMIEQNPNCKPGEPRICYTFLNRGSCDRPECSFRHLLPGHPDAVADRIKNGQAHKIPAYAKEALSRAPAGGSMGMMPPGGGMPACGGMGGFGEGGGSSGGGMGPEMMAYWQYNGAMMGWDQGTMQQQQMMMMQQQQQQQQQQHYSGGQPQQASGGRQPQQAYGGGQLQQSYGGAQPQQPYCGGQPQQPYCGVDGSAASLGETRICFPFLNRGACERGQACRFRHLAPDHPDAIADRMRTGRMPGNMQISDGMGGVPGGGMPTSQQGMPGVGDASCGAYGWQGPSMPTAGS